MHSLQHLNRLHVVAVHSHQGAVSQTTPLWAVILLLLLQPAVEKRKVINQHQNSFVIMRRSLQPIRVSCSHCGHFQPINIQPMHSSIHAELHAVYSSEHCTHKAALHRLHYSHCTGK